MIIDAHTHIFPPQVVERREDFLASEPAFASIYSHPQAQMVTAEGLVEAMDTDGVDVSWAMGFPWSRPEHARMHNDYLVQAVRAFPERLRGFACCDAAQPWATAECERALADGLHGLGELAFYTTDLDLEALAPLCRLCAEAQAPLLLHTNEPVGHQYPGKAPMTLASLYRLIKDHPDTKLVLAHMGAGLFYYATLKKEVSQVLANVWLDTAAAPFLYQPRAYALALELLGADRLLVGTDYPLLRLPRYRKDLESPAAGLSAEDLANILGRAAAGLLA